MRRLRNYLRLPSSEKWLLARITTWLWLTWLGLRILPFQSLYQLIGRFNQPGKRGQKAGVIDPYLIAAAVDKSGRYFLGSDSCFPQALTGYFLLTRAGFYPHLCIGVMKVDNQLKAHAWVEMNGDVLVGGPLAAIESYTVLPELEKAGL